MKYIPAGTTGLL